MGLTVNNRRVYEYAETPVSSSKPCIRDNITFAWSLNALIRYWNCPNPTMFRYNKSMDAPLTDEEKKRWGM